MQSRSRGNRGGFIATEPDLLEADPEISALGHDLEDAAEQVVGVAERLERLAVELAADGGGGLGGAGEELGGLGVRAGAEPLDRLEPEPQVLGRLAEELRGDAPGEDLAAGLLGVEQLAVARSRAGSRSVVGRT